jgi:hypothetical protein
VVRKTQRGLELKVSEVEPLTVAWPTEQSENVRVRTPLAQAENAVSPQAAA